MAGGTKGVRRPDKYIKYYIREDRFFFFSIFFHVTRRVSSSNLVVYAVATKNTFHKDSHRIIIIIYYDIRDVMSCKSLPSYSALVFYSSSGSSSG